MKKIICITGIDGSGKSTLIEALQKQIPDSTVANIWQSINANQTLFKTKEEVFRYMFSLTVNSRVLFLAHAIQYGLEKAMLSNSKNILIDGYLYKYFGAELVLGADENLVKSLISLFPIPDRVICLELDPALSFARKTNVTSYECGFTTEVTLENYVSFQNKAIEKRNLFDIKKWSFIDSRVGPEILLQSVLQQL